MDRTIAIETKRNPLARKKHNRRWIAKRKIGPYAWTTGYGWTRRGALRDLRRIETGKVRR